MAITALGCQPVSLLPFLAPQRLGASRTIPSTGPPGPVSAFPFLTDPCPVQHSCFSLAILIFQQEMLNVWTPSLLVRI